MATDKIAAAIAASAPAPSPMLRLDLTIRSGKKVGLVVPIDLTPEEALDLIGYIVKGLPSALAQANGPRNRLLVPTRHSA